ncbi:MAG TPA: purine-nucleoside phosphorylase, partial [Spirochaetia bacterium]|nr:purine-nucleoside phosphorylase [Spirochaetia bacterium]
GIGTLLVTNASGGINPAYHPGDLVLIRDHINLLGVNPLSGPNDDELGPRFHDMTVAYSGKLRLLAREVSGLDLAEGVYAALSGPSYETPAEIGMLTAIGADLVGMSTVPEVIAARYLGVEVLGVSCVTNLAAGLGKGELDHGEVMETGKRVEKKLGRLIEAVIERLAG